MKLRLVIDTNRVFAALIRDSITREILLHPDFHFIATDIVLQEVNKYKDMILKKSTLDESDLNLVLKVIYDKIELIPISEIILCVGEAKRIMDHIDPDDTVFIALALCSDNDGIWTEDNHFEKQTAVRIWRTKEMMNVLFKHKM